MNRIALVSFVAIIVAIMSVSINIDFFIVDGQNFDSSINPAKSFQNLVVAESDYAIVRTACDVDGDGFSDVIGANLGEGLVWYRYPNWSKYVIGEFNWNAEDIACGDMDNDGDYDIIGVQDSTLCWYENSLPNGDPRERWKSHYIGTSNGFVSGLMVGGTAATISKRPNGYSLSYVEGMAKPKVNGKAVKESVMLKEFDEIEIGSVKLQFFVKS